MAIFNYGGQFLIWKLVTTIYLEVNTNSNPYASNLNVADAIDCNLNGLCDGHFLGSEITSEISDCTYFCRETKVNRFHKYNNLLYI